jgi:hypothetical protein
MRANVSFTLRRKPEFTHFGGDVWVRKPGTLSEAVVQEHSKEVPKKLDDWNISKADMILYLMSHFFNTPTRRTLDILTYILPNLSYMFRRSKEVINIPERKD